jgi:hypothetical protein
VIALLKKADRHSFNHFFLKILVASRIKQGTTLSKIYSVHSNTMSFPALLSEYKIKICRILASKNQGPTGLVWKCGPLSIEAISEVPGDGYLYRVLCTEYSVLHTQLIGDVQSLAGL